MSGVPLCGRESEEIRGRLREVSGVERAKVGISPPVGVGGGSIVEGRAAFTVSLIDACPSSYQCYSTLVAAVGGCIVQWGPGKKWRREGRRIRERSKCTQMCSQKLLCNIPLT